MVDDEDFNFINQWKWSAAETPSGRVVAIRKEGGRRDGTTIYMHRALTGAKPDYHVDHKDHNCLNNQRKTNLRVCTNVLNMGNQVLQRRNKSGAKGVRFHNGAWEALIGQRKRQIYLGRFGSLDSASSAYDAAAIKYFGEFALTNAQMRATA